jgi:hypothetical protein
MAIERKDRSFDRIFEEVTLERIPMDYVMAVKVNLMDGSTIELDSSLIRDLNDEHDIMQTLKRNDISDVQISLDYESIKTDVSNNVKKVLSNYFNE